MMPRVNNVTKSRKDAGQCGQCGDALPKGSAYRWVKGRYGPKKVRCNKPGCRFRASDLTGSDKLARVYAAQEGAEDALDGFEHDSESLAEDVKGALEEAGSEVREAAEEYNESAENIREHFSESEKADECEEKAQELEGWADEMDEFEADEMDEFDPDSVSVKKADNESDKDYAERLKEAVSEAKDEHIEAWAQSVIEEAQELLGNCPV